MNKHRGVSGYIALRDGRRVAVYPPSDALWACLNRVIFDKPDGAPIPPGEILAAVVTHCSDGAHNGDGPVTELLGLVSAMVRSWPAEDQIVKRYTGAIELAMKQHAKTLLETSKFIDLAVAPPPAIEEAIGRSIQRRVRARLAPSPSELLAKRLAEMPRQDAPTRSDSNGAQTPSERDQELIPTRQMVTLSQAAAMVHRTKRAMEHYKTKGTLPSPSVEGGGGKPDLWDWEIIRPWLETEFGFQLPVQFPEVRCL